MQTPNIWGQQKNAGEGQQVITNQILTVQIDEKIKTIIDFWDAIQLNEQNNPKSNFKQLNEYQKYEALEYFQNSIFEIIKIKLNEIQVKEMILQQSESIDQNNELQTFVLNSKKFVKNVLIRLFEKDVLTYRQILNNLDEGLMEECGFLNNKIQKDQILLQTGKKLVLQNSQNEQEFVPVPTQKWYRENSSRYYIQKHIEQEKYNLLREESEGYSKLIELLNFNCNDFDHSKINELSINIQKVVHLFNLETLKVLDIILESFEIALGSFVISLGNDCYVLQRQEILAIVKVYSNLIEIFLYNSSKKQNIIASLLGFKLSYILSSQDISKVSKETNPKKIIPYNLILLIAILIREDIILTEEILPYFIKKNKVLEKDSEDKVINIKFEEVADDVETYHKILQGLYDKKYLGLEQNIMDPKVKLQVQQDFDKDRKKAQNLRQNSFPYNYILWLITCLIQVNDYEDAEMLIGSMWGDERIDLTIHKDLIHSLNSYLEEITPSMMERNQIFWHKQKQVSQKLVTHQKGLIQFEQGRISEIFYQNLKKILKIQYYFIGTNSQIFLKLIQSVNKYLVSPNEILEISYQQFAFRIAGEYFLPALCLVNEQISELDNELWKIFEKMKYQERFLYYQQLLSKVYLTNINMLNKFVELNPRAIKWTKQLSIEKEHIDLMRNETIKISNGGNTLILASQIVKICSNYNNLFNSLILSMEKQVFNSLALDMVSFCIIKNLSDNQEAYQYIDSEANAPISLTYLSEFASIFYKNFPQVELLPLIQYVLNRLVDGNHSYEALILSNLIQSMSGWKDLEISLLNEKQLQCLAGGIILKIDIMEQYAQFNKSQKSQKRALQNVFYGELQNRDQNEQSDELSFSFRLMKNLAKQCKYIINNLDTEDMCLIQNFFDKIHQIFKQTVDTIYYINQDQEKYKKLMPKKQNLSKVFVDLYGGIPYPYAFYIMRRSYIQLADMNEEELCELTTEYAHIFNSYLQNNIDECKSNISNLFQNNEIDAKWSENSQEIEDPYPYFNEEQFLTKKNTDKWKYFKKEIFAIFWQLELQDIELPTSMYEEQIKKKELEIEKNRNILLKSQNDKDQKKINKEIESIQKIKQEIQDELNNVQEVRQQKTIDFLKKKLPPLFEQIEDIYGVSKFLVQYCLYPRLMFSPGDAIFCIKFIQILVDLKVSNINILNIFAQIMKGIIPTIHCCTSNESENLGVFFMEWFKMIDRWSRSNDEGKKIWENECAQYQGFCRYMGQPEIITQDDYKQKIVKPINQRFSQFLKMCFKNPNKQYMKTKSALKILFRIKSVFPKEKSIGDEILKELKQIVDMNREIQQDIWTLANRYHNDLSEKLLKISLSENSPNPNIQNTQTSSVNPQQNQTLRQNDQQNKAPSQPKDNYKKGDQDRSQTHVQSIKKTEYHRDHYHSQKDIEMKNEDKYHQSQNHRDNNSKQSLLGKRNMQNQTQNYEKEDTLPNKNKVNERQRHQDDNNRNTFKNINDVKPADNNQEKQNNNQGQDKKRIEKQNLKASENIQIQQNQHQNKNLEQQQQNEFNKKTQKPSQENEKSQQKPIQQGIAAEKTEKFKGSQNQIIIDNQLQIQRKDKQILDQNAGNHQKQYVNPKYVEDKPRQKQQEQAQTSKRIVEKVSTPPKSKEENNSKIIQSNTQQLKPQLGQTEDQQQPRKAVLDNEKAQQKSIQQGIVAQTVENSKGSQKVIKIDDQQQIQRKEIQILDQNAGSHQKQQVNPDFLEALTKKQQQSNQKEAINSKGNQSNNQYQNTQLGQNFESQQRTQKPQENINGPEKNSNQLKSEKQYNNQNDNYQKNDQNSKFQKNYQQIDQSRDNKYVKQESQQNHRGGQNKEKNQDQQQSRQRHSQQDDTQDFREYEQKINHQSFQQKNYSERIHNDSKMEAQFKHDTKSSQRHHDSQHQQFNSNQKHSQQRYMSQNDKLIEKNKGNSIQKSGRDDKHSQHQGQYQQQHNSTQKNPKQSGQKSNYYQNDKHHDY